MDTSISPTILDIAHQADLEYTNDRLPGYTRIKKGKGFAYYDEQNHLIKNPSTLERIHKLGIPPAYQQV
jgi:DNA topoisomerase I